MILLPPTYQDITGPVIFLAGPIQGAPLWQDQAITLLSTMAPHIHIASPRRGKAPQFDWSAIVFITRSF